jgi:hypothetical protein
MSWRSRVVVAVALLGLVSALSLPLAMFLMPGA